MCGLVSDRKWSSSDVEVPQKILTKVVGLYRYKSVGRGLLLLNVVEGWLERWIDDSRDFYSSTLRFDSPTVATSLEAMESFPHHPPATSCVQRCAIIGHPVREGLCSIPHTAPARRGVPFTSCGCNDSFTHSGVVVISVARRSRVRFRIAVQVAIWRIVCCRTV